MKTLNIVLIILGILVIVALILMWPKPKIDIEKNVTETPIVQKTIETIPIPIPINISENISNIQAPIQNMVIGDGTRINVETKTAPAGTVIIIETITQGEVLVVDAECETDIIDKDGLKVVDFQSFYNVGNGTMTYTWINATPGIYTIAQYCWQGVILDQNKIYNNATLIIT